MSTRELSRMNDYFARYLLGRQGNEVLLLNFINAVMRDSGRQEFVSVSIQNPYNLKEHIAERESIVDVKALTHSGEMVIIEVQVKGNTSFFGRVLEYWAKNFKTEKYETEDGEKGERLSPVISINLLSFTLFPDIEYAHTSHMIHCCQTKTITSDKLEIHFLELPKAFSRVKEHELETWLRYFGSNNFETEKDVISMQGDIFKKAVVDYEYFKADKNMVSEYEKREIYLSGQYQMISLERLEARKEGLALGLAEGIQKGLEKGIEQGLEQGANQKAIEIAKRSLKEGLSLEIVSKISGLTEEEVLSINNE